MLHIPAFRVPRRILASLFTVGTIVPTAVALSASGASAADLQTWDRVASCESSGDWSINTGNGFYGGLQFTSSTWAEFGGHLYATDAHLATKEQQIAIAEKVLAVQGSGAWPVCSIEAGLTAEAGQPLTQQTPETAEIRNHVRTALAWPADQPSQPEPTTSTPQQPSTTPTTSDAAMPATGKGSAPVDAPITTPYRTPGSWAAGFHTGSDFAVPTGTPVKAVASGTVVSAGWNGAYGNSVVIHHTDGMYSLYAHLSSTEAVPGQRTAPGQQLGLSGSTGNSTGPHLHLEIRTENTYNAHIDPVAYLRSIGVTI
ncbi:transglycosylase family protein [Streptomyces sp. NBC_01077]|uniref:transglycosylase family protein n=1 Tax=Streptomyces sp. NBC_01077 TaxID=2903746 RepID=UPI0038692A86